MKIDVLGQFNPQTSINTSKQKSEDASFESALKKAYDEGDKKKLKEACTQFEGVMLKMLYKQMKATVPEGGFIEESSARGIFQDMLDEELMDVSSIRGTGVAEMMYKQLSARMDRTYKMTAAKEEEKTEGPQADNVNKENGAEPVDK